MTATRTAITEIAVQMIRAEKMPTIFGGDALGERISTIATREDWDHVQTREAVEVARMIAGRAA